ncbi:MAG: DUF5110 domain-containing protein, partial [Chitinophagaceae bacterium]
TSRTLYLPQGNWYDWWDNSKQEGGKMINREVNLETMPIYVREGAIIPFDPIRQYTAEEITEPTTIKIFTGANGAYTWYEDDGSSLEYLKGKSTQTKFTWKDKSKKLEIASGAARVLKIELIPSGVVKKVNYTGKPMTISF